MLAGGYAYAASPASVEAGSVEANSIEASVERSARELLLTRAIDAGLLEPSVEVTLLPRGEVKACSREVEVEALDTRHATRMRFAAVCKAEPAWRTEFIVRSTITAEVLVAAADLRAGQPIDAAQIALERRDISAAPDALSDPEQVVGMSSRRAMRSGRILNQRWLVEPILVKRGAAVTIAASNVGVVVHVAGVAMKTGRRGEIMEVRNKATGKIIRARVVGENLVEPADMPMSSASQ